MNEVFRAEFEICKNFSAAKFRCLFPLCVVSNSSGTPSGSPLSFIQDTLCLLPTNDVEITKIKNL